MPTEAIVCTNLEKRFRRYSDTRPRNFKDLFLRGWKALRPLETLWALRGVSFRLERGRMLGVVGRNGAGKSTLLRLIGGVSKPDGGHVQTRGRLGALLDLGLGFHPDLTGRENAIVNGVMGGLTRNQVLERLDRVIEFAELENFIDAPLRTYSTGMRMRLGFSMAVHAAPDILLIDEVLSVGDLRFKRKCIERIAQLKEAGAAVLLVSHNPQEVEELCDEALWLEAGRVAAQGNAGEVIAEYRARMSPLVVGAGSVAAKASEQKAGLNARQKRMGTLQLEITAVHLSDREGRPVRVLQSGSPLDVHIDYVPHKRIEKPIFQVKLVRDDGFVCWAGSTAASGSELPDLDAPGRIRLHVASQHLAKGDYFVNVGAYSAGWETILDFQSGTYPLNVDSAHSGKGAMDLPVRWELLEPRSEAARRTAASGTATP